MFQSIEIVESKLIIIKAIVIIAIIMALGCAQNSQQNRRSCQDITGANIYIANMRDIKAKEELTQRDVKYISNPLSPNFDIDIHGCNGNTDIVREEAKSILLVKENNITEILLDLCVIPYNLRACYQGAICRDLTALQVVELNVSGALESLEYLGASTDQCTHIIDGNLVE